jgi:phage replication O-like protein O
MANPQLENGFFRIANEIAEALMRTNLNSYQSRVLWAVLRKTYGFKKKEDWVSNSQLVELTALHKQHIWRALKELVDRNIVTKGGYKIAFQKDYQQWRELPKGVTSHHELPKGVTQLPKGVTKVTKGGVHKRRQYTKDILRDSEKPNPDVKKFHEFWFQEFEKRTGNPYHPTFGKEGKLIKSLLKTYPLERLKQIALCFFDSKTPFLLNSGHTIGFFHNQIHKVIEEEKQKKGAW